MMTPQITPFALLALIALSLGEVDAAIVVSAPTRTASGSVLIQQDVTFGITEGGVMQTIVLNDWVTSDPLKTSSIATPSISLSINGGSAQFFPGVFFDNSAGTFNDFTPGDGYFFLTSGPSVLSGDTITVHAATYTLQAAQNFNPLATQSFNGQMFLGDNNGRRLSEIVAIPEPACFGFLSVGLLYFGRRSRP
jgi:hypothetical protein